MVSGHDIFISYSRKDYYKVNQIKSEIDNHLGVDCWMDLTGIESGHHDFTEEIISAINDCKVFLFMRSYRSMRSEWATKEIDFAIAQGKKVVIVSIDKARQTDRFKFEYGKNNNIDYLNPIQREKLMRDINNWLGLNSPDYIVPFSERIRLCFRNKWWLLAIAMVAVAVLYKFLIQQEPPKVDIGDNDSITENAIFPIPVQDTVPLETALTSYEMAFDSVPILTEVLEQIVNNFSAVFVERLPQIEEAVKIQNRIDTISAVHGIPFHENEKLSKQIYSDFNDWVRAGDSNPVESIKAECYETALRLKEDVEIRKKLNQLKN